MELFFRSTARASDGREVGQVRLVVVDTPSLEVTHIAVRHAGGDRLLPLTLIQDADPSNVDLRTDVDLGQFPLFVPGAPEATERVQQRGAPPIPSTASATSRAMALRPTNVALDANCQVEALDGTLGKLAGVRLDIYTNALTSIVVASGAQQRYDVPRKWISDLSSGLIKLATNSKDAARLVGPEAGPYLSVEGEAVTEPREEQHGV